MKKRLWNLTNFDANQWEDKKLMFYLFRPKTTFEAKKLVIYPYLTATRKSEEFSWTPNLPQKRRYTDQELKKPARFRCPSVCNKNCPNQKWDSPSDNQFPDLLSQGPFFLWGVFFWHFAHCYFVLNFSLSAQKQHILVLRNTPNCSSVHSGMTGISLAELALHNRCGWWPRLFSIFSWNTMIKFCATSKRSLTI